MKINFDQPILTIYGEPMTEQLSDGRTKPLTLRSVCITASLTQFPDEQNNTQQQKSARFEMGLKILTANLDTDFKSEEIADIKKYIGKGYGPPVVGPACKMLEGEKV